MQISLRGATLHGSHGVAGHAETARRCRVSAARGAPYLTVGRAVAGRFSRVSSVLLHPGPHACGRLEPRVAWRSSCDAAQNAA